MLLRSHRHHLWLEQALAEAAIAASISPPTTAAEVLLVEGDDPTLSEVLRDAGQNVLAVRAVSPELLERDFAVILVGAEDRCTFDLVRQRCHQVPILLIGASPRADLCRLYADGAADVLCRPLVPEVVRRKVAVFVELFRRHADEVAFAERQKNEFLAVLAHELRNPLVPIVNSLHLLRDGEAPSPKVSRVLSTVDRQVRHLVRLIDDLLDVSRVSHGKIGLRKEWHTLEELAQQAADASRPLLQAREHHLTQVFPDDPVWVQVDPTRMVQIISNLLNNAAKYTERGGNIALQVERCGGDAVVRVRDDGIGIRPEMIDRIFELFVQADRASDRAHGGLGIGLTLVERLVKLHGGRIEVRSDGPGRGSEFVVRLPLGNDRPCVREGGASSLSDPHRALKIVVIEDNADIRETLREVLEVCGHEVQLAEDGDRGIELVCAAQPDVALVDIGLPSIDGYTVARRLRARPGMSQLRLIAMTGYGQAEDRRRAFEAGFDAHLVKPVDPETLTQLLQKTHLASIT